MNIATPLPKLVFLHGFATNKTVFSLFFREMPNWPYTVEALDIPPFGDSTHHTDTYDLVFYKNWLSDYIEKQKEPIVLIGWSFGGLLTLAIAEHFPRTIKGMIWLASSCKFLNDHDWKGGIATSHFDLFEKQVLHNPEQTLSDFIAMQLFRSPFSKAEKHTLEQSLQQTLPAPEKLQQSLHILKHTDLRATFRQLTTPFMHIVGGKDRLLSNNYWEAHNALSTKKTYFLSHSSHAPFLSHPAETWQAIASFMETLHAPV